MRRRIIEGPHGPVGLVELGEGPTLVLLAGVGATSRIWGELPRRLARRFRVLAPDNRGVGASRGGGRFTLEGAADGVAAVLDALGIERAGLLGASMGGTVALATACRHPRRVAAMVLASCTARLDRHGRRMLELLRALLLHLPPPVVGEALMALAFAPPFQESHPGFVDTAAGLYGLDPEDVGGTLAQLEHLLQGFDLTVAARSCRVPALVLAGTRDPLVAVEATRALAAALPRARLLEFADAGHSVLAEAGESALAEVERFLLDALAVQPEDENRV